jgi:hypothetical protein
MAILEVESELGLIVPFSRVAGQGQGLTQRVDGRILTKIKQP